MVTIAENLISVSFFAFTGVVWVYRAKIFGFVITRMESIRDAVSSTQRQRLEALMHLKQTRARHGVMLSNGERIIDKSKEDVEVMLETARRKSEDIVANGELTALKLVKQKQRGLLLERRKLLVGAIVRSTAILLERNKKELNSMVQLETMIKRIT